MGRRKISNSRMREIADARMRTLHSLACREVSTGDVERARRYIHIARRIGMRTRTPMPKEARFCKSCLSPMVPGVNCRIRLRHSRVGINCLDCGRIRRMPYLKEKGANDREVCD